MKKLLLILPFLILISCSVQKRKYQNGYYVNWHKKNASIALKEKRAPESKIRTEAQEVAPADVQQTPSEPAYLSADADKKAIPLTSKSKINLFSGENDSCDVLVFRDGTELRVKIKEVSLTEIKYQKCDLPDGPNYINRKSEIFMIKYANGTREVVRVEPQSPAQSTEIKSYKSTKFHRENHPLALVSVISGGLSLIIGYIALVALVAGVVTTGAIFILPFLAGLIAVITGKISLNRIREQPDVYKGKGMAIPGFIMGMVVVGIYLLFTFLALLFLGI